MTLKVGDYVKQVHKSRYEPLYGYVEKVNNAMVRVRLDYVNSNRDWASHIGVFTEESATWWSKASEPAVDTKEAAAYYHAVVGE